MAAASARSGAWRNRLSVRPARVQLRRSRHRITRGAGPTAKALPVGACSPGLALLPPEPVWIPILDVDVPPVWSGYRTCETNNPGPLPRFRYDYFFFATGLRDRQKERAARRGQKPAR